MRRFCTVLSALILSACAPASDANGAMGRAATADALLAEMVPGWNHVEGGAETDCAHGTDFSFWFHAGNPEQLAIYLQGGGACWFGEICALDRSPAYNPAIDEEAEPPATGILELENPDNPIDGWSVLFVPRSMG